MLKYSSLLALAAADLEALIDGPAAFPKIIADGTVYTDETFTESDLTKGLLFEWNTEEVRYWRRLSETHPDNVLFGATSTAWFNDIEMHTSDDEIMPHLAAMGAIARSQAMVKDKFVTQTREKTSGIYAIRLYLKGKPWVLTIDNYLQDDRGTLKYIEIPSSGPVWAPLLLKAWAKTIGSYYWLGSKATQASALKAFTGCPTYTLKTKDFDSASSLYAHLMDATTAGYYMSITSKGSTVLDVIDEPTHYSLLAAMTFSDTTEMTQEQLYILRDPSAMSYDDTPSPWNPDSPRWTTQMRSQLPFGLTPETFETNGIVILNQDTFYESVAEVNVAHCREGYSSNWYDVELNLGTPVFLNADVPSKDGDIYVSVDPFFSDLMTWATPSSFLQVNPGFKFGWEENPIVKLTEDDYDAGDSIGITAWVTWWGIYSDSSYTVNVYSKQDLKVVDWFGESKEIHMDGQEPSGFKTSSYRT